MKTAAEVFRAEAQRLRDVEKTTLDPRVREELRDLLAALEARARQTENGA